MLAHNYSKISLLTAYISLHHFDIIFLSETYLTSTADINDENLKIPGYIIYRVDHPSDVKKGRVCIFYKIILPLKVLSTNFLQECLNFEVTIRNKKFQCWQKNGGLALFKFLGGGSEKKRGSGFFQGGPRIFRKQFSTVDHISQKIKNVNYRKIIIIMCFTSLQFLMSPTCQLKLKTFL